MQIALGGISSIQTGYSFRSRLGAIERGPVAVIQMKDLDDRNRIDCGHLTRVNGADIQGHHLVRPGDLVFRSRGQTTTSALLTADPGPAVVAAPLFRIRVKPDVVLPEYLNWFLNQPPAQAWFASHSRGTALKMISKRAVEGVEIALPPLERQRHIAELAALADAEQALMSKLSMLRDRDMAGRLLRLAEAD